MGYPATTTYDTGSATTYANSTAGPSFADPSASVAVAANQAQAPSAQIGDGAQPAHPHQSLSLHQTYSARGVEARTSSSGHGDSIQLELNIQIENESYECSFEYDRRRDDPKKTAEDLAEDFGLPHEYVMRVEKILAETTLEHEQEAALAASGGKSERADSTTADDSGAAATPETPAEVEKVKEKEKEKARARKVHEMRLNRIKESKKSKEEEQARYM